MPTLKPVSEKMRRILEMLGETPQEHQEQLQAKKPKKEPPPLDYTSKKIADSFAPDPWRPDARVLFVRRTWCKSCGSYFKAPHWPETFVRQRRKGEDRSLNSHKYTPSRSALMSSLALPHLIEYLDVTVTACHLCPEWATNQEPKESPLCLTDMLSSALAPTRSSPSEGTESLSTLSGGSAPSPSQSTAALPSPEVGEWSRDSSPSSPLPEGEIQFPSSSPSGSSFVKFALGEETSPADAKPTSSPTLEAGDIASTTPTALIEV